MPDAPRKYFLIDDSQIEAAKRIWPQVSFKTWVLVMKRADEPLMLNKAAHKGIGFSKISVPDPAQTVDGMYYRRDMDVLILISGETPLVK